MTVYLTNILFIIWWGIILLYLSSNTKKKKMFCIIVGIQWIIISGFRHLSIGTDTKAYEEMFDSTLNRQWSDIVQSFIQIVTGSKNGKDPGYPILEKIFQIFSPDYRAFLLFIAVIFTVPLTIWIYKNSKNACISFLIYSSLFYAFFSITGHRQTIVTGVLLWKGLDFIKDRKFFSFLILILILSTIHKSVLCVFPFYFLANKKITRSYLFSILFIFIIIFVFKNQLMIYISNIMGYEEYANQFEGAGTPIFTLLFLSVFFASIWKMPTLLKNDNINIRMSYNAISLGLLFIPFTYVDPSAMRVVQYFSIFLMIFIPELIDSFNKKEKILLQIACGAILILLLLKSNPQYMFLWE